MILVVLAFQPALERAEILLERVLARGRDGLAQRFKRLSEAVAAATTMDELDRVVTRGLRDVLDASDARLVVMGETTDSVATALATIGEPMRRGDLLRTPAPKRRLLRRRSLRTPSARTRVRR